MKASDDLFVDEHQEDDDQSTLPLVTKAGMIESDLEHEFRWLPFWCSLWPFIARFRIGYTTDVGLKQDICVNSSLSRKPQECHRGAAGCRLLDQP